MTEATGLELDVEEMLFDGVIHGSPGEYEEHLKELKNVNVRNGSQSTLLHVAVRLGRVAWVEALLSKGADPSATDKNQMTALEIAKEMHAKYAESKDRHLTFQFVHLVAMVRDVTGKSENFISYNEVDIPGSRAESDETESVISNMELNSSIMDSHQNLRAQGMETSFLLPVMFHGCSTEETFGDAENGLMALICGILDKLQKKVAKLSKEMQLSMIIWNDIYKECSLLQDLLNAKMLLKRIYGDVDSLDIRNIAKQNCIDAMMKKTMIIDVDEGKTVIRNLYEELYSSSLLVSSLMEYLQYEEGFEVHASVKSFSIVEMKSTFINLAGDECDGNKYRSLTVYGEKRIYLGALVNDNHKKELVRGHLALSLGQMVILLAYRNNGLPYNAIYPDQKEAFKRVISEALDKKEQGMTLDGDILYALGKKTIEQQEAMLISTVPRMIGHLGTTEAISRMQSQLPSLLEFYKEKVLAVVAQAFKDKIASLKK